MFHLVGKDRLEKVKTLQCASLGLCLTNALPSEERLGRFSLENKVARREKDLFSAYDLISRLKPGKEIDAWVPKKSCWKG